ncbi:MAG: DedA family protein [Deltaproteobacteria bacterium]|nr:DedA family protein [Deltaproteobacteria bacterium]MCL5277811.1 DedA family protein [Deltaproteobacteria bacterium]
MNTIDTLLYDLYPWSYAIIGMGVMIENAGIPVPGEAIMLAAGILSASHRLDPCLVIISGAGGAVIGDNIGYWLGRFGGRRLIDYAAKRISYAGGAARPAGKDGDPGPAPAGLAHLSRPLMSRLSAGLRRTERFFDRHGGKTVFFARFITGVRIFAGPIAGISMMDFKKFFLYNTLGAVVWANTIVLGIMYLGSVYRQYIRDYMDADVAIYGLLLIVLLLISFRAIKRLRRPDNRKRH